MIFRENGRGFEVRRNGKIFGLFFFFSDDGLVIYGFLLSNDYHRYHV